MNEAYARTSDPETSHEAAANVDASHLTKEVIRILYQIGSSTAREIAEDLDKERDSISPRMPRLVESGLIEISSDRRDKQRVYKLTTKGREVAANYFSVAAPM